MVEHQRETTRAVTFFLNIILSIFLRSLKSGISPGEESWTNEATMELGEMEGKKKD